MTNKILINAIDPGECRIARVKNCQLEEFHIESTSRKTIHGNIYKGTITRIEPSLQAAFIDFGAKRHGFLQKHEIHSDYYQDNPSVNLTIQNIVKKGQELLVQVSKDPIMKKGAMLTTYISLPGRYVVLMPGSINRGISRKIEDEEERRRLKDILPKLNMREGYGIIIRTAGFGATKTMLTSDIQYLTRLWENIKKYALTVTSPETLYEEKNIAIRSIRDYFTSDVTEVLIDDEEVKKEVKDFIGVISPKHKKIVKIHKSEKPIFTKFQLEEQIASIFENKVYLKSGGSVIIEQTEALVAIDVNSGKGTRQKTIEETALVTNLEAAEQIGRQLRLRDMGGLIVIDFIDMRDRNNIAEVEKNLKASMKSDKAKTKIGKISKFGLLEMSRQRLRPSIQFSSFEPCTYCSGKGQIPSVETQGLSFLRKLKLGSLKDHLENVKVMLPLELADFVLNKKRKEISEIEFARNINITIKATNKMRPGQMDIIYEKKR